MGREYYRSDGFIIYHCDGSSPDCEGDVVMNTEEGDEGADLVRAAGWAVWRPLAGDLNECGDIVEQHYCAVCRGPKADYM